MTCAETGNYCISVFGLFYGNLTPTHPVVRVIMLNSTYTFVTLCVWKLHAFRHELNSPQHANLDSCRQGRADVAAQFIILGEISILIQHCLFLLLFNDCSPGRDIEGPTTLAHHDLLPVFFTLR